MKWEEPVAAGEEEPEEDIKSEVHAESHEPILADLAQEERADDVEEAAPAAESSMDEEEEHVQEEEDVESVKEKPSGFESWNIVDEDPEEPEYESAMEEMDSDGDQQELEEGNKESLEIHPSEIDSKESEADEAQVEPSSDGVQVENSQGEAEDDCGDKEQEQEAIRLEPTDAEAKVEAELEESEAEMQAMQAEDSQEEEQEEGKNEDEESVIVKATDIQDQSLAEHEQPVSSMQEMQPEYSEVEAEVEEEEEEQEPIRVDSDDYESEPEIEPEEPEAHMQEAQPEYSQDEAEEEEQEPIRVDSADYESEPDAEAESALHKMQVEYSEGYDEAEEEEEEQESVRADSADYESGADVDTQEPVEPEESTSRAQVVKAKNDQTQYNFENTQDNNEEYAKVEEGDIGKAEPTQERQTSTAYHDENLQSYKHENQYEYSENQPMLQPSVHQNVNPVQHPNTRFENEAVHKPSNIGIAQHVIYQSNEPQREQRKTEAPYIQKHYTPESAGNHQRPIERYQTSPYNANDIAPPKPVNNRVIYGDLRDAGAHMSDLNRSIDMDLDSAKINTSYVTIPAEERNTRSPYLRRRIAEDFSLNDKRRVQHNIEQEHIGEAYVHKQSTPRLSGAASTRKVCVDCLSCSKTNM